MFLYKLSCSRGEICWYPLSTTGSEPADARASRVCEQHGQKERLLGTGISREHVALQKPLSLVKSVKFRPTTFKTRLETCFFQAEFAMDGGVPLKGLVPSRLSLKWVINVVWRAALLSLAFTSQIGWRDNPVFAELEEKLSGHPEGGVLLPGLSGPPCPLLPSGRAKVSVGQQCLVLHRTRPSFSSWLGC